MIGFLRGKVARLSLDFCFLDVAGVGYRVFISGATHGRLHMGEEVTLFTHLAVREDAMTLYGFFSEEEYELFQMLISVTGIGPKAALGILSNITPENLCLAVRNKKADILTKAPGIGKKSAERIILELKDKMKGFMTEHEAIVEEGLLEEPVEDTMLAEAGAALLSLGYTQAEFMPILRRAKDCKDAEALIRFALKEFAQHR